MNSGNGKKEENKEVKAEENNAQEKVTPMDNEQKRQEHLYDNDSQTQIDAEKSQNEVRLKFSNL